MPVDLADCDHVGLAIVAAGVLEDRRSIQKHASREGEPEATLGQVLRALLLVELDLHASWCASSAQKQGRLQISGASRQPFIHIVAVPSGGGLVLATSRTVAMAEHAAALGLVVGRDGAWNN